MFGLFGLSYMMATLPCRLARAGQRRVVVAWHEAQLDVALAAMALERRLRRTS